MFLTFFKNVAELQKKKAIFEDCFHETVKKDF
jgi:hypothetical protein